LRKKKNGGPSPRSVDHVRVASSRVHHGPHSGRWPEVTGARPSGRSGARRLAAEAREARRRHGDPSGRLTSGAGQRGGPVAVGAKLSGGARHARCSGRGGEERGVRRSAVYLARREGAFYRVGEEGRLPMAVEF
jgi:hypothetical protein